jgi:thiol-disulfide isomerase/thioredoxin
MKILNIESENVSEFETIIKEMPAFVKIFSPGCGHCIAMAPAWEKLKKNTDLKNLDFALVAINASAVENMKSPGVKSFNGVPTLREIKKGTGEAGKEYNGNRSMEDITKFIKSTFKSKNNKTKNKNKRGGGCGCDQNGGKKTKKTKKRRTTKRKRNTKKTRKHK